MSSLWQQDSSENGNLNGRNMNGEGTGIGDPTPAMVGYLGKCENKNASPGNCPWCLAKGQTRALRYYAVNLEETILLCTNAVCLYPLVSRPLEDVRASLSKDREGCKRKVSITSDVDETSSPSKRPKDENPEMLSVVPEPCDLNGPTLVSHPTNTEMCNGDQLIMEKNTVSVNDSEKQSPEEVPVGTDGDVDLRRKDNDAVCSIQDEIEEMAEVDEPMETSTELVPLQPHLFWKNEDNLCWLDSLLVVLVNCRTIREAVYQDENTPESLVRNLFSTYDKTCAFVKAKEQQCEDKVTRVPADVLDEAERRLAAVRLSLFKVLQPTLKCEIGQKETPVFALPLLLRSDKWAQDLFQHTVCWEFKCTACGYSLNNSVEKTLTTLTQILSDWHPLNTTHRTQCSNCNRKNQRRKMILEKLSSVFALHFVEGLPRKDLSKYSFEFSDTHYNVSTVIQYNKNLKHFVTWIRQSNGSWLELDDLKYPHGITHKRFTLPAKDMHVVFWEAESGKDVPSEITAHSTVQNPLNKPSDSAADEPCVLNAMTVNEETGVTAGSTMDASIGSTTLLDTFEGLSHTDIVTLTLVEETADTKATHVQVSQTPAIVPAVLPNRPVASSLASTSKCAASSPQTCTSGLKSYLPTEIHTPSPPPPAAGVQNLSLLQRHPCFQSTPLKPPPKPKPILKCENNEVHPAKPADMFGGFLTKKSPQDGIGNSQKPAGLQGKASEIIKLASMKTPGSAGDNQPINTTEALRMKLMKKLKAKKKKLAKLNQLLAKSGESAPKPDSTALSSPYSVTSSTSAYDSPAYDQFFAELLSPATPVNNLSPDSTGLLELLNNSQNGETTNESLQNGSTVPAATPEESVGYPSSTNVSEINFEDFIQPGLGHTAMDNTDFNGLDLFF